MGWEWAGDGSNVRLGVRWTRESLDYAQRVLSNLNYNIFKFPCIYMKEKKLR